MKSYMPKHSLYPLSQHSTLNPSLTFYFMPNERTGKFLPSFSNYKSTSAFARNNIKMNNFCEFLIWSRRCREKMIGGKATTKRDRETEKAKERVRMRAWIYKCKHCTVLDAFENEKTCEFEMCVRTIKCPNKPKQNMPFGYLYLHFINDTHIITLNRAHTAHSLAAI